MKKINRQLTIVYYAIYVAAILVLLAGFYMLKLGWQMDTQAGAGMHVAQAFYFFLIVSIPLTLATFNKRVKQWALLEDTSQKLALYKKAAMIRLLIIGVGFISALALYTLMRTNSMLLAAGISAVILLFCKPAEVKIIADLNIELES